MWEQEVGYNASTAAEAVNVGAAAREGRDSLTNIYQSERPKGRSDRMLRSAAIAIFVVSAPPERGGKT